MKTKDATAINSAKQLKLLERDINKIYKDVSREVSKAGYQALAVFEKEWEKRLLAMKAGEISLSEWLGWASRVIPPNLYDNLLTILTSGELKAFQNIRTTRASIFVFAHNRSLYELNKLKPDMNFSFNLLGVEQAKVLLDKDTKLLPSLQYKPAKAKKYLKERIEKEFTAGIINGESVKDISKRMISVSNASRTSAIRSARTFSTGAACAGQQLACEEAMEKGYGNIKKQWICTVDSRTRHWHSALDGETVAINERFSNGLRFPGDTLNTPGREYYNCRCTMVKVTDDTKHVARRIKGQGVVDYVSYEEYVANGGHLL